MNHTKIEWVKSPDGTHGFTWNPITGCLNGCEYCYARRLANGRLFDRYVHNLNVSTLDLENPQAIDKRIEDPFYPRFWEDRLDAPFKMMKPAGIFVCDMSDLFGIGIPERWIQKVMDTIRQSSPKHRFYLLTKQPQNLIKWSPFPDNCWVGVTLTNQDDANRTFADFARVEATIKYLSLEPLLGKVDVSPYMKGWVNAGTTFENPEGVERYDVDGALVNHIDGVIIGSQTKPTVYPKIEWVEGIVSACDKAGTKVFLKDNLKPMLEKENSPDCYNGVLGRWQTDGNGGMVYRLRLRQEMPSGDKDTREA